MFKTGAALTRNAGIDLLRGFSILLVVVHHLGLRFPLKKTLLIEFLPKRLCSFINFNGYEAVFIFFVISGFLISSNIIQRWGSLAQIDLKTFYTRRAARILPCLALIVALLSLCQLLQLPYYTIEQPEQSLGGAIASAFGMYLNWYEGHYGYLPGGWDVLWSLSIEETFYLAFPVVCILFTRRWWLILSLMILTLSLPFTRAALEGNEIWREKAYLPGMSALALGVLTALFAEYSQRWSIVRRKKLSSHFFVIGTLLIVSVLYYGDVLWQIVEDFYMYFLVFGAAAVVLACFWRAQTTEFTLPRGLHWLARMGQLSYEIYLMHMFVVFAIVYYAPKISEDKTWYFLWYLPAVIGSWLLGAALARWFSIPVEKWLQFRLLGKPTVLSPADLTNPPTKTAADAQ